MAQTSKNIRYRTHIWCQFSEFSVLICYWCYFGNFSSSCNDWIRFSFSIANGLPAKSSKRNTVPINQYQTTMLLFECNRLSSCFFSVCCFSCVFCLCCFYLVNLVQLFHLIVLLLYHSSIQLNLEQIELYDNYDMIKTLNYKQNLNHEHP